MNLESSPPKAGNHPVTPDGTNGGDSSQRFGRPWGNPWSKQMFKHVRSWLVAPASSLPLKSHLSCPVSKSGSRPIAVRRCATGLSGRQAITRASMHAHTHTHLHTPAILMRSVQNGTLCSCLTTPPADVTPAIGNLPDRDVTKKSQLHEEAEQESGAEG